MQKKFSTSAWFYDGRFLVLQQSRGSKSGISVYNTFGKSSPTFIDLQLLENEIIGEILLKSKKLLINTSTSFILIDNFKMVRRLSLTLKITSASFCFNSIGFYLGHSDGNISFLCENIWQATEFHPVTYSAVAKCKECVCSIFENSNQIYLSTDKTIFASCSQDQLDISNSVDVKFKNDQIYIQYEAEVAIHDLDFEKKFTVAFEKESIMSFFDIKLFIFTGTKNFALASDQLEEVPSLTDTSVQIIKASQNSLLVKLKPSNSFQIFLF